jgi:DNA-binding MarR family transcriptional regulator
MYVHSGAMTANLDKATLDAWVALLRAQHHALAHVEAALKAKGLPPLSWYDVLLELSRVPDRGLRPFELEREMLLPQYGLSRLTDRIEGAGYLEKQPCAEDGRGHVLHITAAGRKLLKSMWPVYAGAVEEAIGQRLTKPDARTLAALLRKLSTKDHS